MEDCMIDDVERWADLDPPDDDDPLDAFSNEEISLFMTMPPEEQDQ